MFEGQKINLSKDVTYLGVTFDRNLNFEGHAPRRKKVAVLKIKPLYCLTKPGSNLSARNRLRIVTCVTIPAAVYDQEVWVTGSLKAASTLTTAQNKNYITVLGAPYYIRNDDMREEVGASDLREEA